MTQASGPQNLRVYGVLVRNGLTLMSAERVAGRKVLKFPGGAVEAGESPEQALRREFREECGLDIEPRALLHAPGTLFSPWTLMPYTPLFYAVDGAGTPHAPDNEPLELLFLSAQDAVNSGLMAEPDKIAIRRAAAR